MTRTATISAAELIECRNDPKRIVSLEQHRLSEAGFDFGRPYHQEYNPLTGAMYYAQEDHSNG